MKPAVIKGGIKKIDEPCFLKNEECLVGSRQSQKDFM